MAQPTSTAKRSVIGVEALDSLIGGGIFDGSTTMVIGVSGVGKTILGTQILREGVLKNDGRAVSADDLRTLAAAAAVPGVDLILITDRRQINRVRDLVVAGNSAQMADAAFVRELKAWLRFSPREAILTGDGLFSAASGNPTLPAWLGPRLFDWVFKADAENEKYARHLASSAGIAVFVSKRDDREHWVLAGRACERFALQATALGLKHAYINQPVEVSALRPNLASCRPARAPSRYRHALRLRSCPSVFSSSPRGSRACLRSASE